MIQYKCATQAVYHSSTGDWYKKIGTILRFNGEILYGETHVLNISEEPYEDKFSDVVYRVYHDNKHVFEVMQQYQSDAEDGAGGLVYAFLPCVWDGYENIKPLTIAEAYEIIQPLLNKQKRFHYLPIPAPNEKEL